MPRALSLLRLKRRDVAFSSAAIGTSVPAPPQMWCATHTHAFAKARACRSWTPFPIRPMGFTPAKNCAWSDISQATAGDSAAVGEAMSMQVHAWAYPLEIASPLTEQCSVTVYGIAHSPFNACCSTHPVSYLPAVLEYCTTAKIVPLPKYCTKSRWHTACYIDRDAQGCQCMDLDREQDILERQKLW